MTKRKLPPSRRRLPSVTTAPEAAFKTGPVVQLDPSELAGLLTAVAASGRRVLPEERTIEGLLHDLWSELHRKDSDLAHNAFRAAIEDGAPMAVVLDLAELIATYDQIRKVNTHGTSDRRTDTAGRLARP